MIPNIIKGSGISGAIRYNMGEGNDKATGFRKELGPGEVTRSEILGGQGFAFAIDSAERVELARRIMEFNGLPENQQGRTKKCRLDCLHASLSWEAGQNPTNDEMRAAAQSFLKALGMSGAQAVYFAHRDTNQPHLHIVASRIDPATGRAFSDTRDKIAAQAWGIKWEREHERAASPAREALHRLVDAVKSQDWPGLADALTERNPTFTRKELDRALAYAGCDQMQAARFAETMLADVSVIGLRETVNEPVTRYTTRSVLEAERQVLRDTKAMAAESRHHVAFAHRRDATDYHGLTAEQSDAVAHATKADGFAMIAGQAGTGKSRAMAAICDSYEAEGCRVVGLAWTNSVVEDLRAKGFSHAATLSTELGLAEGADRQTAAAQQWDRKTVVMVDEAAMLSTKDLAALTGQARAAGAKLILVGDDKQLGSIERGGLFAVLRGEHGAAEINQVQRVGKATQREAFGLMHAGEFRPALDLFEREGALKWAATAGKAEAQLAAAFTRDAQAAPDKSRFIFAHSNAEVDRLNEMARGLARAAGKLGVDHQLDTKHGKQSFAAGDRIQFTGNGQSRQGKEAGFVNGAIGTVRLIEIEGKTARLSVQLDNGKAVSFAVGQGKGQFNAFRHGYAGTIHKGQGKTIDQTYVLVGKGWRADASYVALTRHREQVSIHVPKEVAADKAALASLMGRSAEQRAASGFVLDPASLARSGFDPRAKETARAAEGPRGPDKVAKAVQPAGQAGKQARGGTEKGATAARSGQAATTSPSKAELSRAAKKAEKAGKAGLGMGQSVLKGFAKALAALEGISAGLDSLGKPGPTPEQKIENAKRDAEQAREQAQEQKIQDEAERLSREQREQQNARDAYDAMRALFVAETGETREERRIRLEREERERQEERDSGGRRRGR